jgi:UDP-glucose 4-epimerase
VNILVTGGAGYIGSRPLRTLAAAAPRRVGRIRVLDNMREEKFPSLMNLPEGVDYEFVLGDIRNEDDIQKALGDDTDAVVHLAALCNATISFERRDATEDGPTSGIVDEESPCLPAAPTPSSS